MMSAWIFVLGIPFVVSYIVVTFLYGLIQAIISRKVLPAVETWRRKLRQVQQTGSWFEDNNNNNQNGGSSGNRRFETLNNRTPGTGAGRLAGAPGSTSPVLSTDTALNHSYSSHNNIAYGINAIALFVVHILDQIFSFVLSIFVNSPERNNQEASLVLQQPEEYFASPSGQLDQFDFLQELADEAENTENPVHRLFDELAQVLDTTPLPDSREVFEEMAETRSFPFPPSQDVFIGSVADVNSRDGHSILTDMLFEDLASAASYEQSVKSRPQSLYSAPSVYRSTLDDLADASEIAHSAALHQKQSSGPMNNHQKPPLTFFEEIARSIPRENVMPPLRRAESNFSSHSKKQTPPLYVTKPPLRSSTRVSTGGELLIGPNDSASQCGSDLLAGKRSLLSEEGLDFSHQPTDNGETTDAAKMLFMFGAASKGVTHRSPQRYSSLQPRKSMSPQKSYFMPGL